MRFALVFPDVTSVGDNAWSRTLLGPVQRLVLPQWGSRSEIRGPFTPSVPRRLIRWHQVGMTGREGAARWARSMASGWASRSRGRGIRLPASAHGAPPGPVGPSRGSAARSRPGGGRGWPRC